VNWPPVIWSRKCRAGRVYAGRQARVFTEIGYTSIFQRHCIAFVFATVLSENGRCACAVLHRFCLSLATNAWRMRTDHGTGPIDAARRSKKAGGLGLTLDEFIARDSWITAALKALNDFSRSALGLCASYAKRIAEAFVWGQDDGICRPFIVDGFGETECHQAACVACRFLRRIRVHRGMDVSPAKSGCHGCAAATKKIVFAE